MGERPENKNGFHWRDTAAIVCFVLFGALCMGNVRAEQPEPAAYEEEIPAAAKEPETPETSAPAKESEAETVETSAPVEESDMAAESDIAAEPVYTTVEDDYFADAFFIGDSRTVGLYEYGGLEEIAAFGASTGLTVYKLFDAEIVSLPGQTQMVTVEEALTEQTFGKIYLMIGINEMGTGTVESFTQAYSEAVEHLRELQPDALIYIQSILRVTAARSAQGDYITNEGIDARNEALSALADNEHVFYLDINPMICDETGGMCADYTYDGVHLKAQYIVLWKDYLKSHAISQ